MTRERGGVNTAGSGLYVHFCVYVYFFLFFFFKSQLWFSLVSENQ